MTAPYRLQHELDKRTAASAADIEAAETPVSSWPRRSRSCARC